MGAAVDYGSQIMANVNQSTGNTQQFPVNLNNNIVNNAISNAPSNAVQTTSATPVYDANAQKARINFESMTRSNHGTGIATTRDPGMEGNRQYLGRSPYEFYNRTYGFQRYNMGDIAAGASSRHIQKYTQATKGLSNVTEQLSRMSEMVQIGKLANNVTGRQIESINQTLLGSTKLIGNIGASINVMVSLPNAMNRVVKQYNDLMTLQRTQRITKMSTREQRSMQTVSSAGRSLGNIASIGTTLTGMQGLYKLSQGNIGGLMQTGIGSGMIASNPANILGTAAYGTAGGIVGSGVDAVHTGANSALSGLLQLLGGSASGSVAKAGAMTQAPAAIASNLAGAFLTPLVMTMIVAKVGSMATKYLNPPRNNSLLTRATSIGNKVVSASQLERASKTSEELPGTLAILRTDPNVSVADVMMITMLSAIEANTSPISGYVASQINNPLVDKYNQELQRNQLTDALNETGSGSLRVNADERGWFQKKMHDFEKGTMWAKMQMPNAWISALLQGKSIVKMQKELKDQNTLYDVGMDTALKHGVNADGAKLLMTPSSRLMGMGSDPKLSLMSGMYELLRFIGQESLTIRLSMGVKEQATLHDQFKDNRGGMIDTLDDLLGYAGPLWSATKMASKAAGAIWDKTGLSPTKKIKEHFIHQNNVNQFGEEEANVMAEKRKIDEENKPGIMSKFKNWLDLDNFTSDQYKYTGDMSLFKSRLKEINEDNGGKTNYGEDWINESEIKSRTQNEHIPSMLDEMTRYLDHIVHNTSNTVHYLTNIDAGISKTSKQRAAKKPKGYVKKSKRSINELTGDLQTEEESAEFGSNLTDTWKAVMRSKDKINSIGGLGSNFIKSAVKGSLNVLGYASEEQTNANMLNDTKVGGILGKYMNTEQKSKLTKSNRNNLWETRKEELSDTDDDGLKRGFADRMKSHANVMTMSPREYFQAMKKVMKDKSENSKDGTVLGWLKGTLFSLFGKALEFLAPIASMLAVMRSISGSLGLLTAAKGLVGLGGKAIKLAKGGKGWNSGLKNAAKYKKAGGLMNKVMSFGAKWLPRAAKVARFIPGIGMIAGAASLAYEGWQGYRYLTGADETEAVEKMSEEEIQKINGMDKHRQRIYFSQNYGEMRSDKLMDAVGERNQQKATMLKDKNQREINTAKKMQSEKMKKEEKEVEKQRELEGKNIATNASVGAQIAEGHTFLGQSVSSALSDVSAALSGLMASAQEQVNVSKSADIKQVLSSISLEGTKPTTKLLDGLGRTQ